MSAADDFRLYRGPDSVLVSAGGGEIELTAEAAAVLMSHVSTPPAPSPREDLDTAIEALGNFARDLDAALQQLSAALATWQRSIEALGGERQ